MRKLDLHQSVLPTDSVKSGSNRFSTLVFIDVFGLLFHKIVNPLIMGLIFFGAVMLTALLMWLFDKEL